jgi:hypothetical protein
MLNNQTLADDIVSELKAQGFDTDNEHAMAAKMATAIASAVVKHVVDNLQLAEGLTTDLGAGPPGTPHTHALTLIVGGTLK